MPDFDFVTLRGISEEMRRLAAVPQSHKDYAAVQVALEELRTDYNAMRDEYQRQYRTDPTNPNRALTVPEQNELNRLTRMTADPGAVGTGRMAFAKMGLPFGLAERVASATQGVPLEDVQAQTAMGEELHPIADAVGQGTGVAANLVGAPKAVLGAGTAIVKAKTARIALRRAELELKRDFGDAAAGHFSKSIASMWGRIMGAVRGSRAAATSAQQTAATTAPTSSLAVQVGATKNAATTAAQAAQAEKSAGQMLAESLAQAKQESLAIDAIARRNFFMKQGFSIADAEEMVRQGVSAPKGALSRFMKAAETEYRRMLEVAQRTGVPPTP